MRDDENQPGVTRPVAGSLEGEKHFLFLSHAGVDSEAALRLAKRIEDSPEARQRGLKVWIDKVDLGAGSRWKDTLQAGLADSTAFAVYVGSRGVVNWVWDEVSVALDRAHAEPAYPLVPILAPGATPADLPSFLSQYQGVGDTECPEEFAKLLGAVLRLDPRAGVAAEADPFVGLKAYDSGKAHLFFGRGEETDELVRLLRAAPLLMVTGDSGSGKSSLVLAGLVPAFRGGRLGRPRAEGPDDTIWHVVVTRPGTDPFALLADHVREAAERTGTMPNAASDLADLVRTRQPDKVRDAVLSGAPKDPKRPSKILVVVDQFEEFRNATDAAAYAAALLRLATPGDDRIRVVLTMRRDYYYTCASFPELYARLEQTSPQSRYLVRRMSPAGLEACIVEPLRLAGVGERDRTDLARAVLKDVGDEPGELALLQMALWRSWAEAHGRGPDLVRAYGDIGRVEGALAQAAEEVFGRLGADDRQRAENLFLRLVQPGEAGGATRRVARLAEFDEDTHRLARHLSKQDQWRLLALGESTVEIAHEQLGTQWLRYQRWLTNAPGDAAQGVLPDPRGDDLRLLQSLIVEAARWHAAPPDDKPRSRATGVDLELYQQLEGRRSPWLSDVERSFVADSAEADRAARQREEDARSERERLTREKQEAAESLAKAEQSRAADQAAAASRFRNLFRAAVAVAAAALLAAAGLYWFWQKSEGQQLLLSQQADGLRDATAKAEAGQRAAEEAVTVAVGNESRALAALADTAARKEDYLRSVKLALAAWPRNERDARPRLRATIKALGDSQKYQRQLVPAMRHQESVSGAVFSRDESRLLTWSDDGTARLWDISRIPKGNLLEVACALLPSPDLADVDGVYGIRIAEPICTGAMPVPVWQDMQ